MKKKFLIPFLIIIGIICANKINVYADDSSMFYLGEWIPDIFFRRESPTYTINQQGRFIRRKSDGMPVYCIQSGVSIDESISYNSYTKDFDALTGFSREQMEKVMLIAYYGYGYTGHLDDKWYAITQILIWRTLHSDLNIYYTDSFRGNDIEGYINEEKEILNMVENHMLEPDFEKIQDLTIDEEIVITDINNSLDNYEMESSDNIEVTKEGNTLTIKAIEVGSSNIKFYRKANRFNYVPIIYIDNSSQNIFMAGDYKTIEKDIEFKVIEKPKIEEPPVEEEPPIEEETIVADVPNTFKNQNNFIYISSFIFIILGSLLLHETKKYK